MFERVFGRSSPDEQRHFHITMSAKKPVTLKYTPKGGDEVLLAKETTVFKGEAEAAGPVDGIQFSFEGENVKTTKNYIKLEITY